MNEIKLVEKITRAKIILESERVQHKSTCVVESDPESFAPCNCGASAANTKLDKAIKALSFE